MTQPWEGASGAVARRRRRKSQLVAAPASAPALPPAALLEEGGGGGLEPKIPKWPSSIFPFVHHCTFSHHEIWVQKRGEGVHGGGGLAQDLGIRLFALGGTYWPLATTHSDPLWVRTCFGCDKGPGGGGVTPLLQWLSAALIHP